MTWRQSTKLAMAWMGMPAVLSLGLTFWLVDGPPDRQSAELVLGVPLLIANLVLPIIAARIAGSWRVALVSYVLIAAVIGLCVAMESILFVLGGALPRD